MNNDINLIKGTLKAILETINGLEGLEMEFAVDRARSLLIDFKNQLRGLDSFETDQGLAKLDEVFASAGWDDQGLRWANEFIFVMEFTDATRTEWVPA
jgi:hypothetical protein